MNADLRDIYVAQATEYTLTIDSKPKQVVLVYVPFPSLKNLRKSSYKLSTELEKKLKLPVFFVAKRAILSRWIKENRKQMRPRSRTLMDVHDAILEDICMPGSIIGRRIRYRIDGSRFFKV